MQDIGDRLIPVPYPKRLLIVAGTMADGAWRINAREKEQLDHHKALTFTARTAAFCYVEGEPTRVKVLSFGLRCAGEQGTHCIEQSRVCREVGTGCPSYRPLVDHDEAS